MTVIAKGKKEAKLAMGTHMKWQDDTYQALADFAPISLATSSKLGFAAGGECLMQVMMNRKSSSMDLDGAMVDWV